MWLRAGNSACSSPWQRDLEKASDYYNRALEINPKHVRALEYQGELFIQMGKIELAKANLEKIDKNSSLKIHQNDTQRIKRAIEVFLATGKELSKWQTENKKEINEEKIFELATNAGANDCIFHDEYYEIHTKKDEIYDVKNIMEKEISNFISTEIEWTPINKIKLNQEDKEKMFKFLEILEEDDDVQNVFTNAE